jgi:uncharacterized protein YceK
LLFGCQTSRSLNEGCPAVYSGVRYFKDQASDLPIDGKLFFLMDLPLTTLMDTLILPATIFMEPERPPHGYLRGCRWANQR